jgi:Metallo-peptidase family M12/Calx-beta domain/Reprolysin family propeptide/Bacterial pre-peptidase C-terminal domain
VQIHRKLLSSGLIAAIILSVLAFPSLGSKSFAAPANAAQEPVVTGELVQSQPRDEELSKHLRKYDLIRMDPARVAAQVRNKGRLLLKSSVRDFDLQLTPHDMRSSDYTAQVIDSAGVRHQLPKTEVNTYKGEVKGLPGAQARFSLTERGTEGAIITKQGRYFLQPARSISKQARTDEFVLYDSADVATEEATCGVTLADEVVAQQEAALAGATGPIDAEASGPISSISPMKVARIATDADGEYVAAFGGASQANAQITSILNFVDGIYQSEIGITFQIVQQNAWADANTDPYTSTSPSTRLGEFRNYWNTNFVSGGPNAPSRSLAHLFTGVDLDGFTIGIASLGVTCRNPNFAYGLSQRFPLSTTVITAQTVVLTAHEIGHNFSAAHTDQPTTEVPPDIDHVCDQSIMESSVGNGSSFCPFSRSQIVGWASAFASCLTDTATPPPTSQDCVATPIAGGVPINGSLTTGDCRAPSRGVDFFADRYTFDAAMGQQITITMNQSSGNVDPYLYLIAPDGYVVTQADFGSGLNAQIPEVSPSGVFTLPQTGRYIIEATSSGRGQTGDYQLTLTFNGCTLAATASAQNFPAGGGAANLNVTASGTCGNYNIVTDPGTNGSNFILLSEGGGVGSRAFTFNISANSSVVGRRSFILIGTSGGNSDIGGLRIPITQSGTGPDCVATPIAFGQTLNGDLADGDCQSPVRGAGFVADRYTFNAAAGQRVAIQASAASAGNPDTFLTLLGPNGVVLLNDDDSGGGQNSRIPGGNSSVPLGLPGTYTIEVTAFQASGRGSYSLTLTTDAAVADGVQFSQPSYTVAENAGSFNVVVNRTGNTSGAATVNYATSDAAGLTNCQIANGIASERCDYGTTVGILRFAAGETSKIITIPIVNDVLVEGNENFSITLSGATGTPLGSPQTATVTIVDNDTTPSSTNPIDGVDFFVTQQYIDFLGRLPDTIGFQNWVATLNGCPNGGFGEFDNPNCDRVHVSAGFFLSAEFQGRGYFAYRFYEVALARRPTYAEFVPDMALVGGPQSPESEVLSKAAYTVAWTQRAEFKSRYDGLSNAAYVDALEANAGVVLSNKTALIAALNGGQTSRGQVLRDIVESQAVSDRFFNRAFVAMQYFGYLRRDPDTIGFQNWLNTLNADPNNFRHMIFGFLFSTEYRQRFGP